MLIYLIGFMGCGKSSIGKRLAERLDFDLVDLDDAITERAGMSIPEYFAARGEDAFRVLERNTLAETFDMMNTVVATGGGVPCHFDNLARINENGLSVYLKNDTDFFIDKLLGKTDRPLVAGKSEPELRQYIEETLSTREPFYLQAKYVLTVGNLGKKRTAKIIASIAEAHMSKADTAMDDA